MSQMNPKDSRVLDIGNRIWAIAFHPDGQHLLSGSGDGLRRYRIADGEEVKRQTGKEAYSISLSRDGKWAVVGTMGNGVSVWDAELLEKVVGVEEGKSVWGVDVSGDSTRFATGTGGNDNKANIWSIPTGERLAGPLEFDAWVTGIRFSPNDEQIAISTGVGPIEVFDSHTLDKLIRIETKTPNNLVLTPLAWSDDGRKIIAACTTNRIKVFDVSTGTQLIECQVHDDKHQQSIALACNSQLIAAYAGGSTSLWDTSTLSRIGPTFEGDNAILPIGLSLDSSYLAIGRTDGKITLCSLDSALKDFHDTASKGTHEDEHPSTSDDKNKPPNSSPPSSHTTHSRPRTTEGDIDLLEVEIPTSTPAPPQAGFDYDEPPSPASSVHSGCRPSASAQGISSHVARIVRYAGDIPSGGASRATTRRRWLVQGLSRPYKLVQGNSEESKKRERPS
ncbi:WD40-repeat-containing domain protein [Chiua virens]|nr:WD40-repeat-containing domain protein [Chiua virens]